MSEVRTLLKEVLPPDPHDHRLRKGPHPEGTSAPRDDLFQNIAYRHAADRQGMPSVQGLIVRLPKLIEDPAWEVMPVPETLGFEEFLAALQLWRWQRRMEGKPVGTGRPLWARAVTACRMAIFGRGVNGSLEQ